jgi:hypothetical protein
MAITTHRARVNPHTEEHGNSSVQDVLPMVTNTIHNQEDGCRSTPKVRCHLAL